MHVGTAAMQRARTSACECTPGRRHGTGQLAKPPAGEGMDLAVCTPNWGGGFELVLQLVWNDSRSLRAQTRAETAVAMPEDERLPQRLHDAVDRAMRGNFKLIMLAGFPGSGKSTFAKLAREKYSKEKLIVVLEQDELGCSKLEDSVGRAYKEVTAHANGVLIVDRCNPTERGRRILLDWCFNPRPKDVLCVHIATPKEVCAKRVSMRIDHPTIRFGSGEGALKHFVLQMEPPAAFCRKYDPASSSKPSSKKKDQEGPPHYEVMTLEDAPDGKNAGTRLFAEDQLELIRYLHCSGHDTRAGNEALDALKDEVVAKELPRLAELIFPPVPGGGCAVDAWVGDVFLLRKDDLGKDAAGPHEYVLDVVHYATHFGKTKVSGCECGFLGKPIRLGPNGSLGLIRQVFLSTPDATKTCPGF